MARASAVAGDALTAADWKVRAVAAFDGIADTDDRDVVEGDIATLRSEVGCPDLGGGGFYAAIGAGPGSPPRGGPGPFTFGTSAVKSEARPAPIGGPLPHD